MPRTVTIVNPKHFAKLKDLVLDNIDFKLLRSVDCDRLAKLISEQTNTYINGITFKRLFNFTKYPFNPSIQTLDILSQFVGYRNWYDFELSLNENQPISGKELDILLSFYDFDLINHIVFHDGGIQSMSRKIALRFREDVTIFKRAIPLLARKKYAQVFFIEHFPDYDNLCNYYYLLYEEYLKYTNKKSAQIMCNALLFLKSLWTLDEKSCKKHILKLNKICITKNFHPYLIGRYFACKLIFESFYGKQDRFNKIYEEYLKLREQLPKNGNHFLDFPASEYIVADGLLNAGEYRKCIEIVECAFHDFSFKMEFVRKGYYRQMQLLWAISQKKLNPRFKIGILLQKINPNNFYFISQKYYSTLLYYGLYLENGDNKYFQKANQMAEEMGNSYIKKQIKTYF